MLRRSIPTIASSLHLPNPLLPTVVIARKKKKKMTVPQQVLLHPAATQFLTFLPAISLFLRDGRKRAIFIAIPYCSRSCAIQLYNYSPSWKSHVAPPKPEEIFRMPGMYKLCQLSAVFSSHFLGRTLSKNNFFITYSVWILH